MASGPVRRANRPNTWLRRPAMRREDFPCQLGAVHTWHIRDITRSRMDFRFRGKSGRAADITRNMGSAPPARLWRVPRPVPRASPECGFRKWRSAAALLPREW
jgi:hypothetical protein